MTVDGFLGRALTDPTTGLPNMPYFSLVQDWEERRAQRRNYAVRVLTVTVHGGDDRTRRTLSWRLCQEIRTSDLIASEGRDKFRVLLTSPDAENAEAICARVELIGGSLAKDHPDSVPIVLEVSIEPIREPSTQRGPCDPCDEQQMHGND